MSALYDALKNYEDKLADVDRLETELATAKSELDKAQYRLGQCLSSNGAGPALFQGREYRISNGKLEVRQYSGIVVEPPKAPTTKPPL